MGNRSRQTNSLCGFRWTGFPRAEENALWRFPGGCGRVAENASRKSEAISCCVFSQGVHSPRQPRQFHSLCGVPAGAVIGRNHAAAFRPSSRRSRCRAINVSLSYRASVVINLKMTLCRWRARARNAATWGLGCPNNGARITNNGARCAHHAHLVR